LSERERLGVALSGHWLDLHAVTRLVREADTRGFEVAMVDGDDTRVPRRPRAPLYDASVLSAVALADTRRIRVGAIRLPGFSNAAALARALATLQIQSDGRALGFFGVGSGRHPAALGLPDGSARERIAALDETLDAVRALLRGEEVTRRGRHVRLELATAPPPARPVPIVVAAAGPRALEVVARHADVWDANMPPLARHLESARAHLPRRIETWMWIFARPNATLADAYAAYRRVCPWFEPLAPDEREAALLFGNPGEWRDRIAELRARLGIDLAILDLSGLDENGAREACTVLG